MHSRPFKQGWSLVFQGFVLAAYVVLSIAVGRATWPRAVSIPLLACAVVTAAYVSIESLIIMQQPASTRVKVGLLCIALGWWGLCYLILLHVLV
jgi:hypothetical protein